MKILYIDPVINTATSANYKYYEELYRQLKHSEKVVLYGGIPRDFYELYMTLDMKPDFALFGLGWFEHKYFESISNIDIPTACLLFKPQNDLEQKLNFCKINNIDVILTPVPNCKEYAELTNIRTELFPYGFDPQVFKRRNIEKIYDVGFSGALHESKYYPVGSFVEENIRTKIGKILSEKEGISVFWSSNDSKPSRIPDYEQYAKTINSSKIWIATQAAFGDITPRFYEVVGSGTLLFCQEIPECYRNIFVSGKNCVEFKSDLSDFEEKLDYYLSNERETQKIIENAIIDFQKYTWNRRADHLLKIVNDL